MSMLQSTSVDAASAQGRWMKLGEAAFALGVSEITLRRKIKGGRVPYEFRDGKYFVFMPRDPDTGGFLSPMQGSDKVVSVQPVADGVDSAGLVVDSDLVESSSSEAAKLSEDNIVDELRRQVACREEQLRTMRRVLEDQETLIGFLEQSISALAENRLSASFP